MGAKSVMEGAKGFDAAVEVRLFVFVVAVCHGVLCTMFLHAVLL